jgi:hypothetical protein
MKRRTEQLWENIDDLQAIYDEGRLASANQHVGDSPYRRLDAGRQRSIQFHKRSANICDCILLPKNLNIKKIPIQKATFLDSFFFIINTTKLKFVPVSTICNSMSFFVLKK